MRSLGAVAAGLAAGLAAGVILAMLRIPPVVNLILSIVTYFAVSRILHRRWNQPPGQLPPGQGPPDA